MSVSTAELQSPVDDILTMLGVRMDAGQIVIHVADGGLVQKIETNTVHRPKRQGKVIDGVKLSA